MDKRNVTPRQCLCGCDEMTKGGEFAAGHDARFKAALINVALASDSSVEQRQFAVGVLEGRKWTRFLDKARERRADGYVPRKPSPFTKKGREKAAAVEAALTPEERRAIAERKEEDRERLRLVKEQQQARAQEAAMAGLDRLAGMKRAIKIVRAQGLKEGDSDRQLQVTGLNWESIVAAYPEEETS